MYKPTKKMRRRRQKPKQVKLSAELVKKFEESLGKLDLSSEKLIKQDENVVPVSVCMIVKNCAENLDKCLASLKFFLLPDDEIVLVDTGSTDDTVAVGKKYGANVIERPDLRKDVRSLIKKWLPKKLEKWDKEQQFDEGCLLNFAEARQISTDAAKHDCIFWLDSDDVLEEGTPGQLRSIINKAWDKMDCIFLDYDYAHAEDGKCITVLKRERILDRRNYYWAGRCHETMIPKGKTRGVGYPEGVPSKIVHTGARHDHEISDMRNYCIIRSEIEESLVTKEDPDTRSIFYMGNACRGLSRHNEALAMYKKAFGASGSRDDRYSCMYYSALTYMDPRLRRPLDSLPFAMQCLQVKPEDPRSHYLIARIYATLERWNEAMFWAKAGMLLPEPKQSVHSYDPQQVRSFPYVIACKAAIELGDEELAKEYVDKLSRERPDDKDTKSIQDEFNNFMASRGVLKGVSALVTNSGAKSHTEQRKVAQSLVAHLPIVPPEVEKRGLTKMEGHDCRLPTEKGDLAIFCGGTEEPWGPKNRETGIGGSEKMVLEMTPYLMKAGYRVTVYASVPHDQRGEDDYGVRWEHFAAMDPEIERDTVIFWRGPGMIEMPIPAKRRIFWGHDVQDPTAWTDVRCAMVDQVWLLSKYHVQTLGEEVIAKLGDKIKITRNGLDDAKFLGKVERKSNHCFFSSDPQRGLLTAIDAFQEAFLNDDDARLHVCYGFTKMFWKLAATQEYSGIPDVNRTMNIYEYIRTVYANIDADPRIIFHGRVSWAKMGKLMKSCGTWIYPTRFHEISCMTAMEAQAAGCCVVATSMAALAETVDWDSPINFQCTTDPKQAGELLRQASTVAANDLRRKTQSQKALKAYEFESLAQEWDDLLQCK